MQKTEVEVTYLTATVQLQTTKDIINSTFGTSEGGNFLEPFSAPKVANEKVSSLEHYQADEPIQSEKEKSENEKQLQKDEQLETLEENVQTEEKITTAEQDNKSHGILEVTESSQEMAKTGEPGIEIEREETTENKIAAEQHIEVISNQQASTEESQPGIEKEIKVLEEDEKQETVEDKSTSLSGKEVLDVDIDNTSSSDAKEIGEERSFTGVLNKEAEKSFDLADVEQVPEAIGSSKETEIEKDDRDTITDNSIANASIPNVAASQEKQNDDEEETFKNGDTATEKLEKASVTGLTEQEARIEEEEKHNEAPITASKVIIQDAIESNKQEKDGAPEILNIAKESTPDVTNQSDFLEKASLASVTSSGNVNNDEISEQKFDASSIIHEEGIQQKDEGLDQTEAAVVVAEDITSSKLIHAEDHKELESTEHDGRIEPSLLQQNEPENKKLELNAIAEQQEIAASVDDAITTTCVKEESNGPEITGKDFTEGQEDENDASKLKEEESSTKINKEGNANELSPEYIQEDSTATLKVDEYEEEKSKEEIVEETETVEAGESISCEASEHVERSVHVSSVKQEEVEEEEAEDLVPIKASIEENRVDTFSAELAKDDNEHVIVEAAEKTVKVESKGEEDSEKALQKDEPEETPDTEKKEENAENLDNTDSTRKEVLETTVAGQETEEQILEEFSIERPTEENSKEHKEFTALETAPLSTKTGDRNLEEQTISELSSSLAGEETVEDSSKGDENNAIDSKEEKEDKNSEFKEQDVATDLTEEKEPEDSTEPNKDNYATTTTTEHLVEEILAEESKETSVRNSSVVSETNEEEIEEEIQDKGVTINNSDSVPDRIVSEEIGSKEAEPDNKNQVVYSDIALEKKELTSNVDSEVQHEQKSSTEESVEEIPAIASESVEQIEDRSPTSRIENEEKRANSETILDNVPEDSLQDSSTVPSIKYEALTTEASDISEETSARDETSHESAKTPEEELQLKDEDESVKPYDASKLETYGIGKETENEEVQKQRDQELHTSSEQINDINSSEAGGVGTLKMEEATDFAYGNEVSSSEISKDEKLSSEVSTRNAVDTCIESEKAIQEYKEPDNNSEGSLKSEVNRAVELEANTNKNDELPTKEALETTKEGQETRETDSIKDYSPEFANEEQLEGSTNDDKVIVGVDTTPANTTVGKQNLEEQDISEISSSLLQEETVKEILKDDKNAVTNLEEERKVTDLDSKELLEVTDLRGETKYETLEENIEPNKDLYATRNEEAPEKETYAEEDNKVLDQDSSFVSDVSEKVIEDKSEEKEPAVYNSKSVSDGIVSDEPGLKGEPEDKEQVNSFTIEAEEKGSASSATFDVKPEVSSSSVEIREEISTAAYDHGDKMEDKVEDSIDTRTEEEEKITSNKTSAGTVSEETGLKNREPEDEEQVKRYTIAPEDGEKIEDKVEEGIDTQTEEEEKITPAGTVTEETAVKHGEPEDEEQVKSYTIAPEEKDSASSATFDVKPEEDSSTEEKREEILTGENDHGEKIEDKVEENIDTQAEEEEKITSNETSAGIVSEETALKHGEPEDEEQVKSYTIAPEQKDSASSTAFDLKPEENSSTEEKREEILTGANDHGEKIEDKVEENIDTQAEEEEKITYNETPAGTVSEETALKHGEPEDKEQVKSYTIAPEEKDSASSAAFDLKPEENSSTEEKRVEILTGANDHGEKIEDKVEENIDTQVEEEEKITYNETPAGTVSEETALKHGEPEDKEQVKSYTIAPEEKDSASNAAFDVKPEEDSSTEEKREEILTGEDDHGEKIEDKVEENIDTQIEEEEKIISNETPAGTVSEETALKHGEPEDEEQVKSYTIAPEEKDSASSAAFDLKPEENSCAEEKREEILTGANDHGEKIEDKVEENIDTKIEEEEKIISNETPAGTVSEETALKHGEPEDEEQVKSYTIAPEEKDSASSATFDLKPEENSSTEEKREEILTGANDHGEKIEDKVEENIDTQAEEEEKITYNETSAGTVSEETTLKHGEPEDEEQVKSYTIPPDESARSATFDVKPEENSSTEQNSEEILTAAYHGGEKIEEKVEGNNDTGTEEDKKITTNETSSHDIPGDDHLSTEAVERTDEVTNLAEETKFEILEDSAGPNKVPYATITTEALEESNNTFVQNSSSVVEVSEKVTEDVIQDKAPIVSNSSSEPTGIQIEETGLKEAELENNEQVINSNIEPKGKGLASSADIEIEEEENSNTEQNGEKEISAIAESGEKIGHALEETKETDSVEDYSPESSNKEQSEENTKEDKVLVGIETTPSSTSIGKQELGEEQEISETSSSLPGGEKAQEILKDDKNGLMNLKEERKDTELDSKEQLDVTLGKNIESYKDLDTTRTIEAAEAETHAEEHNTILVQDSSFVSEVTKPEKEIGEEIKEIEPTVYNSNSVSTGTASEEIDLKKGEPEERDQVKSYTSEPEEILTAANVHGEKIEDKVEESIDTQIEENKIATSETSSRDIPEADLLTNEAVERLDETPAGDEATDLTEEIKHDNFEDSAGSNKELYTTIAEQSNKILVQNSSLVAEVSEKVIEEKFQDKETVSTATVIEETDFKEAEPENKEHIQNSDIAPEEKVPAGNVDIEIPQEKYSILEGKGEEEIPVVAGESGEKIGYADKNFEASISDAEVVKTATESKAENTETSELQREENLESFYPGQVLAYTSESANQDKIEETLPPTKEIHTESVPIEQQEVAQNFHGESETKVETEISEIESTNETIKAVILTEVTEEIEKADKSENIEEQVIDRESNLKEFHPVSIGEEKESGLVLGENLKEPDSNDTTPPIDSQTEEDTSKKVESSVTEAPDKEKIQDEGITEAVDVHVAVAEEGKHEEEIKGDKAIVTEATAVTNLADPQPVNETVNTFDTASEERNLDVLEYEPNVVLRDDNLNLEKSSSNLVSQHLNLDHRDTETENATVENSDTVQETKKASDVEDNIDETRPTPTAEKLETDEIEEEIKALDTGISEEQLQVQPSTFFAEEQEHETKTTIEELEKESSKEVDKQGDDNIEDSSATQKEEHKELKVSELDVEKLVTNETEEAIKNAPDRESTEEVEKQDNESIEDSSATHLQQEEHKELKVSELVVEKLVTNEIEEDIENAPKQENTMEVEKQDNESIEDSSATHLQQEEHKELKVSELAVENPVTNETEEDIENAPKKESTNEVEKQDNESIEDSSTTHLQQEEQKELKVSELAAEKLVTNEIEEDIKNAHVKESTNEVEKQDNESIIESSATHLQQEEHKELKISELAVEKLVTNEIEEDIENAASETVPKSNSEEFEEATKEKIITDQTLPEEISKEQLPVSSSTLLPREQEDETATTTKKVEEENRKAEHSSSNIEVLDKDEIITDQALPAELSPEQLQLPPLSTLLPEDKEHEITNTVEKTEVEEITAVGSPLKSEKTTETRGEIIETSNLNIDSSEISSGFVSEKIQNYGVFTKTEDTEVNKSHREVVKTDFGTDESQSDLTIEANKFVKNEILDEEIKEDKEVTNDSQQVSLGEANVEESHQEIDSQTKEHPGDKTDGTENQHKELSEADVKEGTNGNTEKLIISEATSVKDHERISVEDRTIEDNSPAEAEEKKVKEEALNLDTKNQKDEVNFENKTTEFTSEREKETTEIPREESGLGLTEAETITSDIKQLEKSSHATLEKQTPREEDVDENSKTTRFTTAEKDVPLPPTEIRVVERGIEEEMGESGGRTTETASSSSSAGKLSLSELMQSSTKETKQQVIEEREVKSNKEAEAEVEHQGEAEKDDEEEEEEEHKGSSEPEPESDAPVIVEASRDIIDVKVEVVAHKKSHNILSGVGSKVKHSISKVKKAITGKSSSHSKQGNKKPDDPSS